MNLSKINPEYISTSCSPRHIQSVIEDLLDIIKKQKELANEVLKLGPFTQEVSASKMANLRELAKDIVWD